MNLRTKTTLCILFTGLIAGITAYSVAYSNAESTLKTNYVEKLTAVRESKVRLVDEYFQTLKKQVSILAQSPTTKSAATEFTRAFQEYTNPDGAVDKEQVEWNKKSLYDFYTKDSDDKQPSIKSPVGSSYELTHQKYDDFFATYVTSFQFADVLLVDAVTADVIYSYQKNDNFAQSVLTNLSQGSHLARAFIEIKRSIDPYMIKFVDFHRYSSANNEPASFLAAPVYDKGKKKAILLFQVSIDKLDETMSGNNNWREEGLGETGESYIVGMDYKMRTNSRFLVEDPEAYYQQLQSTQVLEETIDKIKASGSTILNQKVVTDAIQQAMQQKSGISEIIGYRGIPVLSSYTPAKIDDIDWVILTEIDINEMYAPIRDLNKKMILSMSLLLLPLIIFAGVISKRILDPLHSLIKVMEQLGKGIFTERVDIQSNDEIGVLADLFNHSSAELQRMSHSVENYSQEQETLKEKIDVMTHLNTVDTLTGIYNRNKFEEVLKTILVENRKADSSNVMVMLDIDNFKQINDTFGHDFGDEMLMAVTEIVKNNHREADIFARWGGDEFILLLPNTKLEQAEAFVERLRKEIEIGGKTKSAYITCSFGVTKLQIDDDEETVFKRADSALYEAKEAGRNCVRTSYQNVNHPRLYVTR